MSTKNTPIRVGVFRRLANADRAVTALSAAGFPTERISVVCPTCSPDAFSADVERVAPAGARTPRAALTGGAIGGLLGGLVALAGIAATGGVGLLVAGGSLLGAAGAGAVSGGFIGAMTTRGFEPEIADYYDQALTRGSILVAVDTAPGTGIPPPEEAERVFAECGAEAVALRRG
jgi:hypothetical protein